MDIRCFDVELQKIKNVEYLLTESSKARDSSITRLIERMPAPRPSSTSAANSRRSSMVSLYSVHSGADYIEDAK